MDSQQRTKLSEENPLFLIRLTNLSRRCLASRARVAAGGRPEQLMIYQVIEKAGNKGIWTRDIKTATSVNQNTLTKTLKSLEGRHLIKTAKSVTSKSKKLYMLYELSEWDGWVNG